ncbi:MAG: hypothetical protein CO141_01025 [Candidatus Moranbacteria bacterium CG_4_9_14_3_um_filter_42_9]|nr:MAG: hypothetical protein CO141_01025 [Candidatus Moranbacteria bacterium CG_4_9_14_3_um_filter_42_9]
MLKNQRWQLLLIAAVAFVILLPISYAITFYQNDDWCYYLTVQNFLGGNFTLHPYVGPTLYLQAFLGMVFAKFFGVSHLPVLTLLVGCASLYVFLLILVEHLKVDFKWGLVLGALFFFNPLGVYELWGFMTNHYFLLFLLLGFYFFLKFEESRHQKYLVFYLFAIFCGLLVRQVSLVLPLAASVYFFFKKDLKLGALNFLAFALMYAFYAYLLPLTPRIIEVPLQFRHYVYFDYVYAVVYGSLLILTAYLLPLMLNCVDFKKLLKSPIALLVCLIIGVALFAGLNRIYKPDTISWGEFPYFENILERTGFYPRGVHGTKYYFAGNYDLWRYWDLAAKITLCVVAVLGFHKVIRKNNIFGWFIAVYMVVMIATETFYDRYIYIMIPIAIFFLLSLNGELKKFTKISLVAFVLFLGYLNYLFSADFILVNTYVWGRSQALVNEGNIPPARILGTNAWKLTHGAAGKKYLYIFSYDSAEVNKDFSQNRALVEKKTIDFPLNIFVNPNIYLYEKIGE